MPEKRPKKGLFQTKDSKSHYSNAYSGDLLLPEHISLLFSLNIGICLPKIKHYLKLPKSYFRAPLKIRGAQTKNSQKRYFFRFFGKKTKQTP